MKDWTRKIIGLSLVALFAGYYGGTTLFYHAHEIDGVKIVHSHPYTGDAQHHAHSAASCRTIQLLSGLTFLTSALALFPARPSPAGFPFLTGIRTKTSPGFQAAARIRRPYAIAYGR